MTKKHPENKYPHKEIAYQDKDLRHKGDFIYRAGKRIVIGSVSILFPPLLQIYHKKYEKKVHHLIIDSILALIIWMFLVGNIVLSFWVYEEFFWPSVDIDFKIEQQSVTSGGEVGYSITFDNNYKELEAITINLELPKGFVFIDSNIEPANDEGSLFIIDALKAKEQKELVVKGEYYGFIGLNNQIKADIIYDYQDTRLRQLVDGEIRVDSSVVDFEIITPTTVISDHNFDWQIKAINKSVKDLDIVAFRFNDLPTNFLSNSISADLIDNVVIIENLEANSEKSITFSSKIISNQTNLDINLYSQLFANEEYIDQELKSQTISIGHPGLVVTGTVNNENSLIMNLGDKLTYDFLIRNVGDVAIENIVAQTDLSSPMFNYSTIETNGGSFDGSGIIWNIDLIEANSSQQVSFGVNLKPNNPGFDLTKVVVPVSLEVNSNATGFVDYQLSDSSEQLEVRVGGEFDFSAYMRYYNDLGGQVGYGPNPPVANEITAYRIFLDISGIGTTLDDVYIVTTLPSQVTWSNNISVTAGDAIHYEPATRKVTWTINQIKSTRDQAIASFEVQILPNGEQIGKRLNLINSSSIFINDNLIKEIGAVQTDKAVTEY